MKAVAKRQAEDLERVRHRIVEEIRAAEARQAEQRRQAQDLQERGTCIACVIYYNCSFFHSDFIKRELSPVLEARFDGKGSPDGCLPHTRTTVLGQLHNFTTDDSEAAADVFLLTGLAGTGKTTVAQSLCIDFDRKTPGASFFATRTSAERRDPKNIIQTIVYQLAVQNVTNRTAISEALRNDRDITTRPLTEQVQDLFTNPLLTLEGSTSRILIVIDALDECNIIDGVEGGQLIPLIVSGIRKMRGRVRLVITSREERTIMEMFERLGLQSSIRLQKIEDAIVRADIVLYYNHYFRQIARRERFPDGSWPAKPDFDQLVQLTGKLFVFAAVVIRLVGHPRYDPIERLKAILGVSNNDDSGLTFGSLDELYLDILKKAVQDSDGVIDDTLVTRVRKVIGALVLLQSPLTPATLSELLGEKLSSITGDIEHLSAVLTIPDDTSQPPTIFHPSLADFVLSRCKDLRFKINAQVFHASATQRCLFTMNRYLKRDICDIRDPSLMNEDVEDLDERRERFLPLELQYACEFWVVHLANAGDGDVSLSKALSEFCIHHLLHWIEALSVLGKLSAAQVGLRGVIKWCNVSR